MADRIDRTDVIPQTGSERVGSHDPLETLGVPSAAVQILRYFLVRPDGRPHARELRRVLRLSGASLDRELDRLVSLGCLVRLREGNRVRYAAVLSSRVWAAARLLAGDTSDPVPLLQNAMADVPGVHAAFVFGSVARGTPGSESDIDLFVVEDSSLDRKKLLRQLAEVESITDREVNPIRYTPQTLAERLGRRDHPAFRFLRDTLTGPKRWVAGAASAIQPLVTAAGIRLRDEAA
ncbi:MAG: nucleotidyltransferase domain-containing protein [Gemmatimonadota bacterium]